MSFKNCYYIAVIRIVWQKRMAVAVKSKLDEARQEFRGISQVKEQEERLLVIINFYGWFFGIDIGENSINNMKDYKGIVNSQCH